MGAGGPTAGDWGVTVAKLAKDTVLTLPELVAHVWGWPVPYASAVLHDIGDAGRLYSTVMYQQVNEVLDAVPSWTTAREERCLPQGKRGMVAGFYQLPRDFDLDHGAYAGRYDARRRYRVLDPAQLKRWVADARRRMVVGELTATYSPGRLL